MDNPQDRTPGGEPLDYATPPAEGAFFTPDRRDNLLIALKWFLRWSLRAFVAVLILVAFLIGYGTPSSDAEKMRQFADAVGHWQRDPEFREVQIEYCEKGSDAMRSRVCFASGTNAIMFLRSLPGLPPEMAVSPTSFAHYTEFSRGPLSSYLRLTSEQGLGDTLNQLNYLANKADLNDGDIRGFLANYTMPRPVASDEGALASVRKLMVDADAKSKFTVNDSVMDRMSPQIEAVAKELGVPTNHAQMTVAQQVAVWKNLDAHVMKTDRELWRAKQVNDWLNGIWAQVYGPMYIEAIGPVLRARAITRAAAPLMLMAWVGLALWRRRRAAVAASDGADDLGEARLALDGGDGIAEH